MPRATKFSPERFAQVFKAIDKKIDEFDILSSDSQITCVIQFDLSDKKYIKRIIELNMFPNINIFNEYEYSGIWLINNNQKTIL